jgi:hypothetical protein
MFKFGSAHALDIGSQFDLRIKPWGRDSICLWNVSTNHICNEHVPKLTESNIISWNVATTGYLIPDTAEAVSAVKSFGSAEFPIDVTYASPLFTGSPNK